MKEIIMGIRKMVLGNKSYVTKEQRQHLLNHMPDHIDIEEVRAAFAPISDHMGNYSIRGRNEVIKAWREVTEIVEQNINLVVALNDVFMFDDICYGLYAWHIMTDMSSYNHVTIKPAEYHEPHPVVGAGRWAR